MSDERLPRALRRRSDREAVVEDIEPYLGTTPEQRAQIQKALCDLATEQIDAHVQRDRILSYQDPRSAESLALWRRLIDRARRDG